MIKFDTKASGKFSVYRAEANGSTKLIAEAKNMIVDVGLNAVATNTWASLLKHCLGGSASVTPPASTDTAIEGGVTIVSEEYGAGAVGGTNGSPAMPPCYTVTDYDSTGGMVYRIGKTFEIKNKTASDITVTELGVQLDSRTYVPGAGGPGMGDANLADPYQLFSRAWVDVPFTLKPSGGTNPPDSFVYVVYELRLITGASTTRINNFQVATDQTPPTPFEFPANTKLGLYAVPYAYLDGYGAVLNGSLGDPAGQGFFEPSNAQYYLYKTIANPTGGNDAYFNAKRDRFEANATALQSNNGATNAGVTFDEVHSVTGAYKFKTEDLGLYIPNSFRRARHIIVPPETPSVPENLYGFAISTRKTPANNLQQNGYHIVFPDSDSPWVKPVNAFMKFYLEQTWSWIP